MAIDPDRLEALVLHIANHPSVKDLGTTKLYKLIYFIETKAMRDLGRSLTGSEFVKYEHGPVPSRGEKAIKHLRKDGRVEVSKRPHAGYTLNEILPLKEAPHAFDADESALIESVLVDLGESTAAYLSEVSHREPAWAIAELRAKLDPVLMLYGAKEDPEGL